MADRRRADQRRGDWPGSRRRTAAEEEGFLQIVRHLQFQLATPEEMDEMHRTRVLPPISEIDLELQVQILAAKLATKEGRRPSSPRIPRL